MNSTASVDCVLPASFYTLVSTLTTGLSPCLGPNLKLFLDPVVRVIDLTATHPCFANIVFCQQHGVLLRGSLIVAPVTIDQLLRGQHRSNTLFKHWSGSATSLAATCLRHTSPGR